MRKCIVFKWVHKEGTGQQPMIKVVDYIGKFHQFGCDYEEFTDGPGNFTAAVVEKGDSKIELPCADMVQLFETVEPSDTPANGID